MAILQNLRKPGLLYVGEKKCYNISPQFNDQIVSSATPEAPGKTLLT